jgi:predicted dienelactone hydrolase
VRLIEGLILVALLLALLANFLPKRGCWRWLAFLPGVAALFVLFHLAIEGYRWQMIPGYGLAAVVCLGMMRGVLPADALPGGRVSLGHRTARILGFGIGLLVLALTAALTSVLPVFSLPEPTGSHAVGTQYQYWIDETRPDDYITDPGDFREVSVQIWYPAEVTGQEETIRYMRQDAARDLTRSQGLPGFLLDHVALVRTHAYLGADVAQTGAPFPVITYSTSGLMSSHMTLFEELASHGYIVVCIGHPYWNPFMYGAGGEILPFDGQNEQYLAWWEEADSAAVERAKTQVTVARTTVAQQNAFVRLNRQRPIAVADLRTWAGDVGFVLDQLEMMNQGSGFLAGALDLEHIGIMGFSKGGAAAGQFCVTDERCKAGINLTGFMYGDIVDVGLDTPFMFISEEELWCPDCYVNDLFYKRAESDVYQLKIRGARHTSFGDICLWGRLLQLSSEEPAIEGKRMTHIQNVYSLAFFDRHLKRKEVSLLDGPSADYPEVAFSLHHP